MTNEVKIRTANATFQAEGQPDVNASLFFGSTGPMALRADLGGEETLLAVTFPVQGRDLQVAEVLQFAADTISAEIPGRMTAFQRGFVSTAADIRDAYGPVSADGLQLVLKGFLSVLAEGDEDETKLDEEQYRLFSAAVVSMLMANSIERGWNLESLILDKLKVAQQLS